MEVEEQEYVETGGSGVMVSNLPLLFSRGSPSSLCDMNQSELEVFVPFMVRCSVGEERPVPWSHLPRPAWWPKKLPFRMPTSRNSLMGLVERCYSFHGCDYLLQFCASLVAQMPPSGYRFNDNRDGTTSMYHGTTGKLLVTFRNENRDYDKYRQDGRARDATKKLLLSPSSHSSSGGGGGGSTAMIQPPVTDIYLCDKCENEFYSLKEVQAHERQCCGEAPSSPPTPSPEPEVAEEEPEPAGQVPFLAYFNLRPAQHTGLQPYMSPRKKSVSAPPAKLPGPIYPRYDSIALASPLGKYLFTHSKFRNKYQASQHSVMRYERHLHATPNTDVNFRERCTSRWIVVWRGQKQQQAWVHLYCFNRAQRKERMITIRTGLNRESRRLLTLCRPLSVRVKRLAKRTVDRLKRLGGPSSAPCIDLTDEHHLEGPRSQPLGPGLAVWPGLGTNAGYPVNLQLQWLPGLPPVANTCLPGSSSLPPQITTQLGLTGLTSDHHNSLSFVPFMSDNTQQQQQQQHLTLQASLRPITPGVANNSHFKGQQRSLALVRQDGAGPAPDFPLPADISLIPLQVKPTRSQLEADRMKPLSKKKFPRHDLLGANQLQANHHQQQQQQQQNSGRVAMTFPQLQSEPLQWERVLPSASSDRAGLPPGLTSSSIEIIELSSDEDDFGHSSQGRSEAANAPQQLDGLACYPHTGAKVPSESSEYFSLSKNGNSHWSSQQKSHCGAGRVGDLATNGQPPNVLPSTHKPHPFPPCPQGPHVKGNSRKRKGEEDLHSTPWGKTLILDVSSQGVTVSPLATGNSWLGPAPARQDACQTLLMPCPCPSHSSHASESSNSLIIDEDISFKTPFQIDEDISFNMPQVGPQESGHLTPRHSLPSTPPKEPFQQAGQSTTFLTSLVTKSMSFIKSLVAAKDSNTTEEAQDRPEQHTAAASAPASPSPKRASEIELLLQDECRELQRCGLGELSHLETQGIRLTRRAVGHILPRRPSRRTLGLHRSENRPPHRHARPVKARHEERRGGHRGSVGQAAMSFKSAVSLEIDENGNSASCVGTRPKQQQQQASQECLSQPCSATHIHTCQKLSGGGGGSCVLGNSTVFSDINLKHCDATNNNCNSVCAAAAAGKAECRLRNPGVRASVSHSAGEGERQDSLTSGTKATRERPLEQGRCKSGRARNEAEPTLRPPWSSGPTKRPAGSHGSTKNVLLARGQTPPAARPELTGETAEERGAQLAQCPSPDRHLLPSNSDTPRGTPSPSKPKLMLLNSLRKGHASPSHGPPEQKARPVLCPLAKPHSTNKGKKKRSMLSRELSSLSCDEWKEIRGTGFHPSDLLGCEGVKYLSLSSDDEEARPPGPGSPDALESKLSVQEARKPPPPPPHPRVSREVAQLLKDECKELRAPTGRPARTHCRYGGTKKVMSMHPLAGLAGLQQDVSDSLEPRGCDSNSGRCNTRSQVSMQSLVEVFTLRDTHRHLLRSEVAMCVLNYMLPNIH